MAVDKQKYKKKDGTEVVKKYKVNVAYFKMSDDCSKKLEELLEAESLEAGSKLKRVQAFERLVNKAYYSLLKK